jgi:hypothetical protein
MTVPARSGVTSRKGRGGVTPSPLCLTADGDSTGRSNRACRWPLASADMRALGWLLTVTSTPCPRSRRTMFPTASSTPLSTMRTADGAHWQITSPTWDSQHARRTPGSVLLRPTWCPHGKGRRRRHLAGRCQRVEPAKFGSGGAAGQNMMTRGWSRSHPGRRRPVPPRRHTLCSPPTVTLTSGLPARTEAASTVTRGTLPARPRRA